MRRPALLSTIAALCLSICLLSAQSSHSIQAHAAALTGSAQFENYDIRLDAGGPALKSIEQFTSEAGLSDDEIEARLSAIGDEITALRLARPDLLIEVGELLRTPEVISAGPANPKWLTSRSAERPEVVVQQYIAAHASLFGIDNREAAALTVSIVDRGPKLTVVELQQSIGSIPVFQGNIKAGLTEANEVVRVINNVAPRSNDDSVLSDFGRAEDAVAFAAKHIGRTIYPSNLKQIAAASVVVTFESNIFSDKITAEKIYFPASFGVLRPAWRVLLWEPSDAYYVIVDARDGTLLWRKNLTEYQTQPATYSVYGNSASLMKTADSPAPGTPGCPGPIGCPQPTAAARAGFTLIGNEPPYTFNNLGWIADGENRTIGNAAEAGIDRDGSQGIDPNGWAFGSPTRSFSFTYNPSPGIPSPGEEPLPVGTQPYPPTQFQQGSVTNAFYVANRLHDELYLLGFTEASRNFQTDNFGRGGLGGDSISIEVQDSAFTNGANFSVTADGTRPRAQFTVWTGATPDRDGALDNQMVVHELTHGLTNRLHGNATGLSSNMARGMGEGWSDFLALTLLSEPADDPYGIHAFGCYGALEVLPGYQANCYYGIRRFPAARRWAVGTNGRSHNPYTFRYLNADCNSVIGTTTSNPPPSSAFPRGPIGTTTCDQIHNLGEVWAAALWEVRAFLIDARGAAEGNRRALQYIIDGMKLSPLNPTMLQERDAIIMAAQVSGPQDVDHVRRGFAVRGMGSTASIQNPGNGSNNTVVTESFTLQIGPVPAADFDGDGRTDVSVFRPGDGIWYLLLSNSGFTGTAWGLSTDRPIPADYDGDRKTDAGIFRATTDALQADYYILNSSNGTVSFISWGSPGDIPVTGDYDGDGKADPAIFRPSENRFWVRLSSNSAVLISRPMAGTIPLAGDFDGDGKTDFAVFSNGQWLYTRSSDNHQSGMIDNWGLATDKLAPGDYDGDGKTDLAVYRPSDGVWYIKQSSGTINYIQFGLVNDVPVPGDYDGDSRADVAVFRDGVWYVNRSSSGFVGLQFGLSGDQPLPKSYIP